MKISLITQAKGSSIINTFIAVVEGLITAGELQQRWEVEPFITRSHFNGFNAEAKEEAVILKVMVERRSLARVWGSPTFIVSSPFRIVLHSVALQELLDVVQIDFGFTDERIPLWGVVSEPGEAGFFVGRKFRRDFRKVVREFQNGIESLAIPNESQSQKA